MLQPSILLDHHTSFAWRSRLRAAGVHLGLNLLVAALSAFLVFALWYPWPYREISGGRDLFLLVVTVDVVLGPLLTFAVFDPRKGWTMLRRDLAVIGLLQLAGLAYGLWTVQVARPVHMVFEYDRFRVVHLVEIPRELEDKVPPGIALAPLRGPTLLALRPFRNGQEQGAMTMEALEGVPLAARTELWQPYEIGRAEVLKAARPATLLKQRFPQRTAEIDAALRASGHDAAAVAYLPLVARKAEAWTVLLDANTAEVIGYLPLDSF
jgi:hypothetical protein